MGSTPMRITIWLLYATRLALMWKPGVTGSATWNLTPTVPGPATRASASPTKNKYPATIPFLFRFQNHRWRAAERSACPKPCAAISAKPRDRWASLLETPHPYLEWAEHKSPWRWLQKTALPEMIFDGDVGAARQRSFGVEITAIEAEFVYLSFLGLGARAHDFSGCREWKSGRTADGLFHC